MNTTATIATEVADLLDHQGIHVWAEPNRWQGLDFTAPNHRGRTVRIALDDTQVNLYVFTGGKAMLESAKATFTGMPASVIVAAVAAYLA